MAICHVQPLLGKEEGKGCSHSIRHVLFFIVFDVFGIFFSVAAIEEPCIFDFHETHLVLP